MKTFAMCALVVAAGTTSAQELAVNGGFEAGDTSGWQFFPTPASTFEASSDAFSGNFSGRLENLTDGTAAVIKQANVGIGLVQPGDELTVSFWAKATNEAGGVNFAEFFTELDGGGTSSAQILGGAPLFAGSDWQFFTFDVVAGPDTSGGVTLQITATTGANIGSTSEIFIDDVSIFRIPSPATASLLGLGGLAAMRRRR